MKKERLRQAYYRLAATYAIVEVVRVIRCVHNREVQVQRDEVLRRHCSVVSAETIIAALMAGASTRFAMKQHTGVAMASALASQKDRTSDRVHERQLYKQVFLKCGHRAISA